MSSFLKKLSFIYLAFILLLVSGCTVNIGSSSSRSADGGIWKSEDAGQTWTQAVAVPISGGQKANIANIDVRRIVFDPQDHNTIYLATEKSGLFFTYDGGKNWQQFEEFTRGKVRSIAIDYKNKCNLYLVIDNKLYKSTDCGRFWKNVYFHQSQEVVLTDVIVSHSNSSVIYAVTSNGEIIKSVNGGNTWATAYRVNKGVFVDIIMDPQNSEIVYAATTNKGIYKSDDSGNSWESLGEGLKSYTGSHDYKGLINDPATKGGLILISKYGMLKSRDYGKSWELVSILPSSKSVILYSVAVNPKNSNEIYYTTRTSLVKTVDGGQTWSSKQLPLSRVANRIITDPINPNIIYIGSMLVKD